MSSIPKLWLISPLVVYCCLFSSIIQAQVLPDGTTKTNVTGNCLARCDVRGGIRAGSNLFHSFQEFNIDRGGSVYFADPGVANIFTRVTGGNSSAIFGKLGVTGDANFWLINPQGILFGNGASLDINGSFVATTADEIVFGDRGVFSANPHDRENLPLLTVNPSAFFARQMSQGEGIEIRDTSLAVPTQENLILIGRENNESRDAVLIEGATISAPQGNIQLGVVANEETIEITPDLQLQFAKDILPGKITLTQGSEVNVSGAGAGSVTVGAAELNIQENSSIRSVTLGDIDSGDIRITTQQLNLDRGLIYSLTSGLGKSADIAIDTESLKIVGNGVTEFQSLIDRAITGNLNPATRVSKINPYIRF